MGDDDMIRRGSVLERLDLAEHDAEERDWRSGANEIARLRKYVAAIPARSGGEIMDDLTQRLRWLGGDLHATHNAATCADAAIRDLEAERSHWMHEARRTLKAGQDALERAEAIEARLAELTADYKTASDQADDLAAKLDDAEANIQWLRLQVQNMHRRAQKAEGKLSRTHVMLTAVHGYLKAQGTAGWWMMQHVKAALDHSRQGSGAYARVVFGWRQAEVDALKAQALKDAKAHEKELAVWSENYAALEQKVEALVKAADDCAEAFAKQIGDRRHHAWPLIRTVRAAISAIRKGGEG